MRWVDGPPNYVPALVAHIRAAADTTYNDPIDAGWMEWALSVAEDLDPTALRLNIRNEPEG
jgi:hypothetical protein